MRYENVSQNVKDVIPGPEKKCGVTDVRKVKSSNNERITHGSRAGSCFTIDYAIANDYSMFAAYSNSVTAVQNHNIAVTNDMQTNYDDEFADAIQFSIVQQFIVTTSTGDPWDPALSSSTLLNSFSAWGPSGFSAVHDAASLWSRRDFDGPTINTVGLAWVGVVCTSLKYNVLMDYTSNASSKRVLLAHELGHNFNSGHDAIGDTTIMAPSVQNTVIWSSTSITSIQNHYTSRNCLAVCVTGPPQISFKSTSTSVTDFNGSGSTGNCGQPYKTIIIPVEVNKATSGTVIVTVSLASGNTATSNKDFILVNNVLTFPAGVKTTQNIEVRVIDDAIEEPTENVSLQLNISSGNAVLGSATMHTISISDLDGASATCCSPTETIYGNPNGQYNIIFNGFFEDARSRVLYLPFQLTTAGIQPGYISAIQYFVTLKQSTQPYQNFKVRLANVSQNNLSNMEWISSEEVFHGNISTQNNSWNSIVFDKPFYWNGTSSLYIEFCFDNTSWTQDDYISWTSPQGGGTGTFVQVLYRDEISDCNLTPENSNVLSLGNIQPHLRFTQINTIKVETIINSISKSELKVNEKANFYSQSGKIIASVKNLGPEDIGCIEATIETEGTSKLTLPSGGGDYTAKTVKITANPNALYEVTLYYTPAELNTFGTSANKLNIIKTQSTLATSNAGNSTLTAPDLIVTGLGSDLAYAYSGVFTGFSRFALTDRKIDAGGSVTGGDLVIAEQDKGVILTNKSGSNYRVYINNSGTIITQLVANPNPKAMLNVANFSLNTEGKKLVMRSQDGNYRIINISDTGILNTSIVSLPTVRAQLSTGDLELENAGSALIIKSPNGQCWRMFVNETGVLQTVNIICP